MRDTKHETCSAEVRLTRSGGDTRPAWMCGHSEASSRRRRRRREIALRLVPSGGDIGSSRYTWQLHNSQRNINKMFKVSLDDLSNSRQGEEGYGWQQFEGAGDEDGLDQTPSCSLILLLHLLPEIEGTWAQNIGR